MLGSAHRLRGALHNILGMLRFATLVAVIACASSPTAGNGARHLPDQVSSGEIASSGATNAYELIQRLRPNWLRSPNIGSIGGGARSQVIVVYLDGQRLGDIDSLRNLSAVGVTSMQWLDATKAATVLHEVGSDPIAGAIIIRTH
ncbi:MAG: hypothetical protein NVSMB53_13380 [Gemmatimonadaceae bacterium]